MSSLTKLLFRRCLNVKIKKWYSTKTLTLKNLNEGIVKLEFGIFGEMFARSLVLEEEVRMGLQKKYNSIIRANVGDAHAMGQKPLSHMRDILAMIVNPTMLDNPTFAKDLKMRAKEFLDNCEGKTIGAYTDPLGIKIVRKKVAEYITKRDGYTANEEDIYLSSGGTDAIQKLVRLFDRTVDGKRPAILTAIPSFPLYTALIEEYGFGFIPYYLDEEKNWSLNINEMEEAIKIGKEKYNPRILVVVNPGNPTGQVLPPENIQEIIKFAHRHKLFIFADEVYQNNIWSNYRKFVSIKGVMMKMGTPYDSMELASFFSISKDFYNECGLRGGYTELVNLDKDVKLQYEKAVRSSISTSIMGQAAIYVFCNPPNRDEPSYSKFMEEKNAIKSSLKQRAKDLENILNELEGFKCNPVQGALYAFPSLNFPEKLINEAAAAKLPADEFYALNLLENTGIYVLPGSAFGQKPGTYHIRTTILPQPKELKAMITRLGEYHNNFIRKFM